MTPTQYKIINFIKRYFDDYGYSPSISQIMLGVGYKSKGTTHRYLNQLLAAGELVKSKESNRTVYTCKYSKVAKYNIPLAGYIAAGLPIEAIAESEQLNFFDRFTDEGLYQLKIRGDSMQDIGIADGDVVLIKPAQHASDKQIVVALIDGADATLKRYYKRGKHVELFSENDKYEPQVYLAERVEIQGVLHSVHKFSF